MRFLALAALLVAAPAVAQIIDRYPPIQVKTQPPGTANNTAASTAFVAGAVSGLSGSSPFQLQGGSISLTDIHTSPPANGVFLSPNGATWDYCSVTGCLPGPHLLGASIFNMTSRADATAQESNVSLNTTAQTGKAEDWQANHAYTAGTQIHGPQGDVYQASTSGTSAGSGGPVFCPRSTYAYCEYTGGSDASTGTDGSVTWAYVGNGINDGKSGFSNAMFVLPGAGHTWGMNSSLHVNSGVGRIPMFGFEFDTTNANMDYAVGGPIMANIYLNGAHNYPGTAAIFASMSGPITSYAWHYGMLFQGDQYAKDATIADATSSQYVLQALGSPHVHDAVIRDDTNSARSIDIGGSHTIGIDMTRGAYGTAITLPGSGFVGFNGQANLMGYNAGVGALTYGQTNSGTAYSLAAFDNGDVGIGRRLFSRGAVPTLSGCGTSPGISTGANDTHGTITVGTGGTGCTVSFTSNRVNAPDCIIMARNSGAPVSTVGVTIGAFVFTAGGTPAGQSYTYQCMGQ